MMLPSLTDNVQVLCKKTVDDAPSQLLMVGFLSMRDILSTTTTSSIVVVDIYGCSILEVTFSHLWVIDKAMMMSSSWISRCLCTACQYKVFCLLLCFPDCWKVSSVVPVFKNVGERSTAKNYCPVSLLSVVS